MLTPSQIINSPNFSGQFSLPAFTPYSLLTLNNLPPLSGGITGTPTFAGDNNGNGDKNQLGDASAQNANWLDDILSGSRMAGSLGGEVASGGIMDVFNIYFKDMALIALALILLAIGLYMLAQSTDAGQIAIGVAKKAATA